MSTLQLEPDQSGAEGARQAEPLWVHVRFPAVAPQSGPAADADADAADDADDSGLPEHLSQIGPEEQLLRCIFVRRAKVVITPQALVEGRQRYGMTYQEVIDALTAAASADDHLFVPVALVAAAGPPEAKPFLGGFRDRRHPDRTFHNAATQLFLRGLTYSPFGGRAAGAADGCSRRTQTWGVARGCQTLREFTSQTPRRDVQLDLGLSLPVTARPYFTAAALLELRTEKTILLQKLYRQWKARAVRRGLETEEREKQQRAAARQRVEEAAKLEADQRAHLRMAEPKTTRDFDLLKEHIVAWRAAESATLQANAALTADERRAAMLELTKQELLLLQDLESRRRTTMLGQKDRHFDRTMEAMASARAWGKVQVETPETTRAGELRDLYRALTDTAQPQASRLDLLLHVKWTVKEFDTPKTAELVELIDREADLLHRGRREASLAGLRDRIQNLFKQFIEDPEYNPMMTLYTKTAIGRAKAREIYGTVYGPHGVVKDMNGAASTSHRSSLYLKKTSTS
ncbi:IQ and ubiquitin-like domain-containing protein [Strigomonas culicis]|uniref:IQ and ubiquitin-like domain-containing protein n=1 Tax=Strigomonas culicis TaxID=28005 RepID=S9UES1_9TRYP|nr:IQ and ubiquitin-like domain-containing protein [Strigomonas culicis]|eukprot:EPY29322.1 IQ and ubiquitin-like domain-containing protein [Strigomonas culicis]